MPDDLDLLVADADRERAATELREHYDSGRLTVDEFESRLEEVNGARTAGDLQQALRQLRGALLLRACARATSAGARSLSSTGS